MRFRALEVHTLHIRDFGGERRIQSLGTIQDFHVAKATAEEELKNALFPTRQILRRCLSFGVIFLGGTVLSLTVRDWPLRLPGLAAVFVGVAGCASSWREGLRRAREFHAMSPDTALRWAAWEYVLKTAPRKSGDNDLTYIPLDERTASLSPEELALEYDLLPPLAEKAINETIRKQGGIEPHAG